MSVSPTDSEVLDSKKRRSSLDVLLMVLIASVPVVLGSIGIDWGLPSEERSAYYAGSADGRRAGYVDFPGDRVQRASFNGICSGHPDEWYVLKELWDLGPGSGEMDARVLGWPRLVFYIEGLALALASALGFVVSGKDLTFYCQHPGEIAKAYVVGRLTAVLFAGASAAILYRCGREYYSRGTGVLAGLTLGTMPLITVHSHYLTGDMLVLFFGSLGAYFCLRTYLSRRSRWPALAGVSFGLAMSAKCKAAILLLLIPTAVALRGSGQGVSLGRVVMRIARWPVLIGTGLAIVVFAALNPEIILSPSSFLGVVSTEVSRLVMDSQSPGQEIYVESHRIPWAMGTIAVTPAWVLVHSVGPIPLVLALGACVSAVVWSVRRDLVPVAGLCFVYLAAGMTGVTFSRHMIALAPLLALLAARHALRTWEQVRPRYVKTWLTGAAVVCLIGPGLWKSVGYCRLFAEEDVRLEAGRWISERVPKGVTIGVPEIPWHYDTPPIDERVHRVVVTGYDVGKLRRLNPDYYVISSRHTDPTVHAETPERTRLFEVLASRRRYTTVHVVERMPFVFETTWQLRRRLRTILFWLGLDLRDANAPEDLRYANPQFAILRRVDFAPREGGGERGDSAAR